MSPPAPPVIEAAALKEALRARGLSDRFGSMRWKLVGRFSNEVWRLDLDNGLALVAKKPYRPPRAGAEPDLERRFYRELASAGQADLPVPGYVAELDGVLILEHLELEPFSFQRGATPEHARAAIDALADWHAFCWQRSQGVGWLPDYRDTAFRQRIQDSYDAAWPVQRQRLLQSAPGFRAIGDALVGRLAATLAPLADPGTLVHGDAHAENIPLTPSGPCLLDWQHPQRASPGLDLAVFTTMSFRTGERAGWEQELVERHVARLRRRGCDWPDPWMSYRLGLLRRVAQIVEIAEGSFTSLPWVFRRAAQAALAQHVGELIR